MFEFVSQVQTFVNYISSRSLKVQMFVGFLELLIAKLFPHFALFRCCYCSHFCIHVFKLFGNTLFKPRVYWKQPLYLYEVGVRSAWYYTGYVVVGLLKYLMNTSAFDMFYICYCYRVWYAN